MDDKEMKVIADALSAIGKTLCEISEMINPIPDEVKEWKVDTTPKKPSGEIIECK